MRRFSLFGLVSRNSRKRALGPSGHDTLGDDDLSGEKGCGYSAGQRALNLKL
jgi:hypothetical protein